MKLYFILEYETPLMTQVLHLLEQRGFDVAAGVMEQCLARVDGVLPQHDLYVLKSHTDLALSFAGALHTRGARLLNPYPECAVVHDKIATSHLLAARGVPTPRSWATGNPAALRQLVDRLPLIVKPWHGYHGEGVQVVRTTQGLENLRACGPLLVQEYIEGNGEDTKLYVAGEHVFGVRKKFSAKSFHEPGRVFAVDDALRELALQCGRATGLTLYGIDVIESPRGPFVVDVNYFPGYRGIPEAPLRVAEQIEQYALRHMHVGANRPRAVSSVHSTVLQ